MGEAAGPGQGEGEGRQLNPGQFGVQPPGTRFLHFAEKGQGQVNLRRRHPACAGEAAMQPGESLLDLRREFDGNKKTHGFLSVRDDRYRLRVADSRPAARKGRRVKAARQKMASERTIRPGGWHTCRQERQSSQERPDVAVAAVLASLLIASGGGGSLLSQRCPRLARPGVILDLAFLVVLLALLLPHLFTLTAPWPRLPRGIFLCLLFVFPGALMGIPFPTGLRLLGQLAPELIPWAWTVNGAFSVLAPMLAAMLALIAGFQGVLLGAAAYLLAFFLICPFGLQLTPGFCIPSKTAHRRGHREHRENRKNGF
jgi:hypothetical protein